MYFIIIIVLGFYLGYKFRGSIEVYKQVKSVKNIELIVEKILNHREIKVINDFGPKEEVLK